MNDNTFKMEDMSNNPWHVDDLRAVKHLFVQRILEGRRKCDSEIEIISAVSPDAAIIRLEEHGEMVAKGIALIERVESALRELASNLDADGSIEEQIQGDPDFEFVEEEWAAALDALRRFATNRNGPLTREAEEERDAALRLLVPTMRARGGRSVPASKREPTLGGNEFSF